METTVDARRSATTQREVLSASVQTATCSTATTRPAMVRLPSLSLGSNSLWCRTFCSAYWGTPCSACTLLQRFAIQMWTSVRRTTEVVTSCARTPREASCASAMSDMNCNTTKRRAKVCQLKFRATKLRQWSIGKWQFRWFIQNCAPAMVVATLARLQSDTKDGLTYCSFRKSIFHFVVWEDTTPFRSMPLGLKDHFVSFCRCEWVSAEQRRMSGVLRERDGFLHLRLFSWIHTQRRRAQLRR